MGYKFEVKQTGDSIVREFSEPVDSSLGTKWPCKKNVIIVIVFVVVICLSIGIGVGIHIMEKNMKEKSVQSDTTSPTTNTGLPTPKICPWFQDDSPLVLISIGGYRADYLSRNFTPTIHTMSRLGVTAPYMVSVNPTLTQPNLYTIVTGLYPESHGIVHDTFTDPKTMKKFNINHPDSLNDKQWWKGEPIWVTLGRQNKTAAAIGWPGTDVNLSGFKPTVFKMNPSQNTLLEPIQQIFNWLEKSSNQRPNLILWYIDYAVKAMQRFGPNSPLVWDKLAEIDGAIRNLWTGLKRKSLDNCVNLIIVSDHGMSSTSSERIFNFQPHVSSQKWSVNGYAFSLIQARNNVSANDIEDLATKVECQSQNVKVFTKSSVPKRYHVFNNPMVGDAFLQANDQWISSRSKYTKNLGSSGYDNRHNSMRALFLAVGPGFLDHFLIEPFENIELYNMISELMKVKPSKNNGTTGSLNHIINAAKPLLTKSKGPESCRNTENWNLIQKYLYETPCYNKTSIGSLLIPKLKDSVRKKATILKKNLPMGPPIEASSNSCYVLLYQTDFVVGASNDRLMPLWISTTLDIQSKWTETLTGSLQKKRKNCVFTDARMDVDYWTKGTQQNQDIGFLYNTDFLGAPDAYLSSNAVRMFTGFRNGIWKFLWQTLKKYSRSETVNVIVGPVFDKNHNGIFDRSDRSNSSELPIPSHFFIVLSKCREKKDTNFTECLIEDKLDILSFVLPHRQKIDNCMNYADFLQEHIVRIRDIELLTGLHFFKAYQHQSVVVRHRVFMPASLWPSFDTEKWLKQPCFYTRRSSCPREPAVLLISLSGFGPSHFALSRTPVLDKIRTCGIRSTHMRPVYPSNNIPNMYSIVTGVFPESHGLLSKYMNKGENQTTWEPIWVTAEKQNKSTAVYGWPGLKDSINGSKYPKWIPDGSRKFGVKKRIQMILDWLSLSGNERVDFIGAHFEEPDLSSHKYGANSHKVGNALTSIDAFMGQLMDGMKERNLEKCVNLIIVSDHGTQGTSFRRVVDKVDLKNSFIIDGATVFQKSGLENATVNDMLENISCTGAHFRTYTKATLPQRFHFTNNGQIGDVILTLDDGWLIKQTSKLPKSTHGYDNRFDSMQSIFLASGPSFQFNMTIEPFENIELYNLLTELLLIQPAPNNGTEGTLNKLLMNSSSIQQISPTNYTSCCSMNSKIGTGCAYSVPPQNDLPKQVPFGVPNFHKTGNFCILHTDSFSLAQSNDIQMPLWFAYNLPKENSSNLSNYAPISCFENANHNVTTGSLFFSGEQYDNGSSKVPMYKEFKEGVWKELGDLVREYTVKYTSLNVISGPIFKDGLDNAKRLRSVNCSVPIPTHFYVILSKLSSADMSVEVLPIILPHVEKDQNCLKPKDYFFDHTARIKDIELLTGLTFMTDIPWEESIKMRTYLPLEMWESLRPSSWMKLQHCVNLDKACINASRPVLLVSLDGFRADYTTYEVTPVINRLRECGIQTSFMRSSFPSKTFPNHYTIATGLYPESHGIVGNYMYDMEKNSLFTMSTTDPYWWGGETIWKTLSKAGKESGSYFFVGSSISGVNATYFYPYSGKTPFEDRIDQTVAWLKQGVPFVTLYFEEPDTTGHREGPSSKQILNTLRLVDSYIGQLMNKLYEENMHNCVNIIIVADHGMTDVNCERSVVLWDIIDKETATKDMYVYSDGRVTNKYWQEGKMFKRFSNGSYAMSVPELMSKLECSSRHMKVFQKEFLPKRLHYTKHKRIGDIQLLINDTWYLQRKNLYCGGRGSHGYDNRFKSMNALFLAYGPDFKQQLHTEPFQNIEIYNLLTDLLNIPGAPNNGTEGRLRSLLRRPPPETLRQSVGQYKNVSFNMAYDDLALFLKEHRCLNFTPTNKEVSLIYTSMAHSNNAISQEISFGLPLLKNNVSIQLLKHKSYLTAYDTKRKRLLFMVTTRTSSQPLANFSDAGNGCVVDPRVHFDQMKYDQTENNYTWLDLAPTDFADDEEKITSFLSTNFIRVAKAFKKDLWVEALKVVQKWRTSFSMFTWFVGPIYDYNLDGLADDDDTIKRFTNESLPTNVFFVLVGCQNTGEIEATTAYILPSNQQHFPKCRKMSQMLRDHQARVRDVELLTNLEFYPKEPFQKAVIHRTSMIDVKLQLKD